MAGLRFYFGGGLNEQQSPHVNEAAAGSYNFELNKDLFKLIPRKPFDLKGTATNASDIRGFIQLITRDNVETTLAQAAATVYKWDGASVFSSVGTVDPTSQLRDFYWSLNDWQIVTDLQKLQPVSKWDGTTFGVLSTGLGTSLYAKYGVTHQGRSWLFNVKTSTDTPHLMVASAFENAQSYDTTKRVNGDLTSATFSTGNEAFYMLTPDLRPINGACVWQKNLIISTTAGRLFMLTGTSSLDYAWSEFYVASNAVGNEAFANMGNDLVYMRRGGNIESLKAVQFYGDVTAHDLSRWIPTTVKDLTDAIVVYDQSNQKVFFFIAGKVLVFFKDIFYGGALMDEQGQRSQLSPWSVYTTQHANGFGTHAAKYMRVPGGTAFSVYFGDSAGRIFDMNGVGASGDGGTSTIAVRRKTRFVDKKDGVDFMGHVTRGAVQYRRTGACNFSIDFDWSDEYNTSSVTVALKGVTGAAAGAYFGGLFYFGGTNYFGGSQFNDKISHQNFSAVGKASGARLTFYADTNVMYNVDNVELA